ncbi:hypothetical protein GSI_06575 [Ganoderma sinense ZZ0214-1]|uniref:Uncharacterized protein n=1 Tax=Ganoderma sinense ZZ0214-1 TaxID=1077348 RepID=A0A2G8SDQ1_9APHY|nr:hypothetical protein GSI_06575 [Ganoderma sinense ZZ0214-1]
MDFSSHIFCRKDVGAEYLPGLPVRCIILEVDGPTAVKPFPVCKPSIPAPPSGHPKPFVLFTSLTARFHPSQMILPTDEPKNINAAMIAGWLAAHNGPCVETCAMTPSQREILLTLVCGYRAFLELPPGVEETDFYTFAHKLIDAAFELGVLEPADKKLREIADWLEATLPATCFLPVLDDTYEARDPEDRSKDDMTDLMAAFASMLDPRLRAAMQGTDLGAVLSTSSTTQPSTPSRNKLRNLRKKARKAARKAAESLPPNTTAVNLPSGALANPSSPPAPDSPPSVQSGIVNTTSADSASAIPTDSASATLAESAANSASTTRADLTSAHADSVPCVPPSEAIAPITCDSMVVSSGTTLSAPGVGAVLSALVASDTCVSDIAKSEGQARAVDDASSSPDSSITQHAVTVEEVPDVDVELRRAPILDVKGKGRDMAVLEEISDEDGDDGIPGLVDVEDSSDGEDDAAYVSEVIKVMRAAPFVFKQY